MTDFRTLSESVLASPQISIDDVAIARACGISMIVNNRPEGEADDQTSGAAIEAAASAIGLNYVAIPVAPGSFSEAQVRAMIEALTQADGKVLAYCRTGTRSTFLWALAQAAMGRADRRSRERRGPRPAMTFHRLQAQWPRLPGAPNPELTPAFQKEKGAGGSRLQPLFVSYEIAFSCPNRARK